MERRARIGGRFPGSLGRPFIATFVWLLLGAVAAGQSIGPRQAMAAEPAGVPRSAPLAAATTDSLELVSELDVNGLKVLVKRRDGSQTVVAGLFLRGGAAGLTAQQAGVEGLMLDLAAEASANIPLEQFRRELSRMGTDITSNVAFDYSSLVMNSTRLHFDRSWEIFADAALRPSFSPDEFALVKSRAIAGLRSAENTPDAYLQVLQARAAFAGHPYMNDPHGTVASISGLTLEDVQAHHQRVMETSRLLLVLVGDLDPREVRQKVEVTFGRLPRGNYRAPAIPQLSFSAPSLSVTPRNIPTNYVQGIFAAPPLSSRDYHAMRVATSILQSRVYEEVRELRNLSYSPDAFLWNRRANAGGIYVTADDVNQSVSLMLNEITLLQRLPITERQLSGAVQHFLTTYYLRQETNAAQAGELAHYELIGGGWRNAERFLDQLRAVTPEDVRRVANTYMRNLQFVVLGDPSSVDRGVFTGTGGR